MPMPDLLVPAPWPDRELEDLAASFSPTEPTLLTTRLAEALRFERLLADLSSSFAALVSEDFVPPLVDALRQVVLALGYDRSNVSELSGDRSVFTPVASWARPGIEPHAEPIRARDLPWYAGEFLAGRMVCLSRLPDELPPDAVAERAYIVQIGMKSHLALPLIAENTVMGFVGLGSFARYVAWPDSIQNRLRTLAGVFANTIVRVRGRRQITALAERLEAENLVLRTEVEHEHGFEEIVGRSAALQQTLALIAQVAPTDATVLVTGETGTGKELVARASHARSPRADRPVAHQRRGQCRRPARAASQHAALPHEEAGDRAPDSARRDVARHLLRHAAPCDPLG
jgi:transcriptional regulator with GAF, ATPase, and Fis domain